MVIQLGDSAVHAVRGVGVLGEIVGADPSEVHARHDVPSDPGAVGTSIMMPARHRPTAYTRATNSAASTAVEIIGGHHLHVRPRLPGGPGNCGER